MGLPPRFRRFGRSSPALSSLSDASGLSGSRQSSGVPDGSSSAGSSPPSSGRTAAAATARSRPRPSTLRTLLLALLPALVALGTVASMSRRQSAHSELADALLAANAAGLGGARGSRQLGEAADPAEGAECADALQIPQVAMLFLVKGPLRHEAMWRAWFERAEGLLPAQAVSNALCASEDGMPAALAACSSLASPPTQAGAPPGVRSSSSGSSSSKQPGRPAGPAAGSGSSSSSSSSSSTGSSLRRWLYERWHPGGASRAPGVLDRQHLFDVYVHPHPNFTGYPAGSLLHGRELPDSLRVATEWGTHTLVDAAEALLAAALKNPRNQKFFMLSESDLPLYSPHVMYLQLMSEHRSRINACNTTRGWDLDYYRWVDRMETSFLNRQLWRKSSQWFVLNRKHAELILQDRKVERVFQQHCRTTFEEDRGEERVCYADEHYFPTLLAVHGLDHETDCQGRFMDVDWSRVESTSPHPWEYKPGELSDRLIEALRRPRRPGCGNAAGALAAAPAAYIPQRELFAAAAAAEAAAGSVPELEQLGRGVCRQLLLHQQERPKYPGIGPECPLMARKFSDGTVKPALMALAPCDSTALVLNDGRCPGESERQRYWRLLWWRLAPWVLLCSCALLVALPMNAHVPLRMLPQLLTQAYRRRRDARLAVPLLDV
ncbi:hypothetical protein ABPG75_001381 [Micractinium tetrahymenae]